MTDLIDGMLAIGPESRLTVAQVLASHYAQGTRLPAGEQYGAQAVYRGSAAAFNDPNALRALLAEESDEPMRPVYRGGPAAGAPRQRGTVLWFEAVWKSTSELCYPSRRGHGDDVASMA